MTGPTRTGAAQKTDAAPQTSPAATVPESDLAITLDVEPRKPRLAWQGMERKELAGAVPTQVVEIVRPSRAVERKEELKFGSDTAARREELRPENRLIWTNDNLVALQTLLEEKDPKTRDYRYRGKVDLVYIDPPFMVNDDFRADNAIDIELDEKAGVQAKKEPSLVEIIAYKDTWRRGLDSFLSMLRARLLALKQLLSPTGSIYVHLDWHAVHYVKVLMDELFGYESLINEVIWRRYGAHNDTGQGSRHFGRVHDTLLAYSMASEPPWKQMFVPLDAAYVGSTYRNFDKDGRRFRTTPLTAPGGAEKGNPIYEWKGHTRAWRYSKEKMAELDRQGRLYYSSTGYVSQKLYLDESLGVPLQDLWTDITSLSGQNREQLGYPTQKPLALVERIISASCPSGGMVLDCFVGSGTTAEAAEKQGCRWIGIDNSKYAIHLSRKRLIQLHEKPRPSEKPAHEYVECKTCKNLERREKPQKAAGQFRVAPFTVENMGVYQRASEWQGFQQHRSEYRDEMIRVFGGDSVDHSPLLHGRKGNSWVHVGPLDAPVSSVQVWAIAREAQRTDTKALTILSADFDTLSASEKDDIKKKTGVAVTIRVIPASAIDEVRRRLDLHRADPKLAVESTAIPAFYAPLAIVLEEHVSGKSVELRLKRCEVDIESFISSQRPMLKPIADKMTEKAKKKALDEIKRWEKRERELKEWLAKAKSWQAFVDFWSIDWNYGGQTGEDGKPIFVAEWQSFRTKGGDSGGELTFSAKTSYPQPGKYRIAARVTDVFGNDGIATVEVEIKR